MKTIAIIGCGRIANGAHLPALAKLDDVRIKYACDLIIEKAQKAECGYAVDVFMNYGTDANAAMRAGNNLRAAAFGMAVYCSHGMERTHIDGIKNTLDLLLAYMLDR